VKISSPDLLRQKYAILIPYPEKSVHLDKSSPEVSKKAKVFPKTSNRIFKGSLRFKRSKTGGRSHYGSHMLVRLTAYGSI
jgi:hypothetical protein